MSFYLERDLGQHNKETDREQQNTPRPTLILSVAKGITCKL